VARGTIGDGEVTALAGTREDRKRYLHQQEHGKRNTHNVLHATADLAASIADSHVRKLGKPLTAEPKWTGYAHRVERQHTDE
jgi:hypothetical protein